MSIQKPIIVLGAGRSGTTVVSEILFRHRELAFPSNYNEKFPLNPSVGYIRMLFDNRFYRRFGKKKQTISETPFFNRVLFTPSEAWSMWEYITGLGEEFSRSFLLDRKSQPERAVFIRNYFQSLLKAQGKSKLAFKLTGPARIEFLLSIFDSPYFIYIDRRPVPMISSFLKIPFWQRQGLKELWWKGPYSDQELELVEKNRDNNIWMTAFQIKKVVDMIKFEIEKFSPNLLHVQYEDFASSPVDMIHEMLDFCNLSPDNDCLNYPKKNKIVSRNFHDTYYFSKKDLEIIYSIFGS